MTRSFVHRLGLAAAATLTSFVFAGSALAGLSIDGCLDPSSAAADAFLEATGSEGDGPPDNEARDLNACEKVCRDGRNACRGSGKSQLGCTKKVVRPVVKAIQRQCRELDDDECLADLQDEIGQIRAIFRLEQGETKDECDTLFDDCRDNCGSPFIP